MKHFIIILTGFLFVIHSIYMGAEETEKFRPRPSHPLDPLIHQPRIMADEMHYGFYLSTNNNGSGGKTLYIHSMDGLSDTVHLSVGKVNEEELIPSEIRIYSKENRLEMIKYDENMNGDFNDDYRKDVYTYNDSGWLVSKTTHYNWFKHETTAYDYRNIIHTDSGYILNKVEYILDDQGRLTRMGDMKFSYFEEGYIEYDKSIIVGATGTHKLEHYFNEEGYCEKTLDYKHKNGKWELLYRLEYTYTYNNPSDNEEQLLMPQPVYGTNGAIIITIDITEPVYIYNISGQLVKEIRTQPNERIPMSKGLYIIRFNGDSYKVIVR